MKTWTKITPVTGDWETFESHKLLTKSIMIGYFILMDIQLYKQHEIVQEIRFMETQVVTKWGNSLGLRIPASMAKQAGLAAGTNVTVTFIEGALIIKPERKKKYTLDELLEGMTPEKVHAEVDMGEPVGHEVW